MTIPDDPEQGPKHVYRDTLLWVHVEVTRNMLVAHAADLEDQGRWPAWAVLGANMSLAIARYGLGSPAEILARLRADVPLQDLVLSAYRMGTSYIELYQLITEGQ